MNNKGFTLVELLATISILALLMIVPIPNVISTIDKNKQSTYVEDAKRMITLAEYKVRSDTSITLPTSGNCIVMPLYSLDLTDFDEGPEGGNYDLQNSYLVIARNGNKYEYYATIIENYGDTKRGLPLISREDLNKENAKERVVKGDELTIVKPQVGGRLTNKNYIVSKIY